MFDAQTRTSCHQVLCEVLMTLGEASSKAYLIGGWAIYYVLDLPDRPISQLAYAGTLDVDVALILATPEWNEFIDRLISKGYVRDERIENRWHRGRCF